MAFHENLVHLRKKANLSQEQLAESLNVTRQAISKWESGLSTPDVDKLLQLSDIFQVPLDQLLKTLKPIQKEEKAGHDLYTILTFAGLIVLWVTGMVLMIINVFFNQGQLQVPIYYCSLVMMLFSLLAFAGMLVSHHVRKSHKKKD